MTLDTGRLVNDAGTNWIDGGYGPSGNPLLNGGTLSNSVCTLNVGASSAQLVGSILTVNYSVSFNSGFTGDLATFLQELDVTGQWAGVTQFGNWTAFTSSTAKSGPSATPVTPTSGAGSTGTFSHSSGLSNIYFATMLVSCSITGNLACQVLFRRHQHAESD